MRKNVSAVSPVVGPAFGLEEHAYNGTGTNTSNTYYYTLGGRLIGKFDGTNTQFYATDILGSVVSTFNAVAGSGAVLGNQVYGPYGYRQEKRFLLERTIR